MDWFSVTLWLLAALVLLLIALEIAMQLAPGYRLASKYPGPEISSVIGILKFIYSLNPEKAFSQARDWAETYKQSYVTWSGVEINLEATRAHEMEIILSSSRHTQKGLVYELLRPFLGDGLLNSNGKKWQQRRRILTPTFHFSILQQFLVIFKEEGKKVVQLLKNDCDAKQPTHLVPLASRFTLNTISETSMGVKLDALSEADEYRQNVYGIGEILLERFLKPWLHDKNLFRWSTLKLKFDRRLKPVHAFTRNVIKTRRQQATEDVSCLGSESSAGQATADNVYGVKKQRYAMLDTLLAAEAKGDIDAEGIREEVDTFMFEGHDTTATGLVFIFFLMAQHREVQQRVYEEIKSVVDGAAGESLNTAEFNSMGYTDRVIKECMRMYPPVPFISRDLTEDIRLSSGHRIPKGTAVNLHIYDLHRDPEQFPNPDVFDPDRFLPDECEKRHPFAYLPFSAGPRNCIGQKYAMLEMKSCLTDVLLEYEIKPVTKIEDIVFFVDIVLRTKCPVKVQFVKRN